MPLKIAYKERRRTPRYRVEFETVGSTEGGMWQSFANERDALDYQDRISDQFKSFGIDITLQFVTL